MLRHVFCGNWVVAQATPQVSRKTEARETAAAEVAWCYARCRLLSSAQINCVTTRFNMLDTRFRPQHNAGISCERDDSGQFLSVGGLRQDDTLVRRAP